MSGKLETQCWICPFCFDDHSQTKECEIKDLKAAVSYLQGRQERQVEEIDRHARYRGLTHKKLILLESKLAKRDEVIQVMTEALELIGGPCAFYCEVGDASKSAAARNFLAAAREILRKK